MCIRDRYMGINKFKRNKQFEMLKFKGDSVRAIAQHFPNGFKGAEGYNIKCNDQEFILPKNALETANENHIGLLKKLEGKDNFDLAADLGRPYSNEAINALMSIYFKKQATISAENIIDLLCLLEHFGIDQAFLTNESDEPVSFESFLLENLPNSSSLLSIADYLYRNSTDNYEELVRTKFNGIVAFLENCGHQEIRNRLSKAAFQDIFEKLKLEADEGNYSFGQVLKILTNFYNPKEESACIDEEIKSMNLEEKKLTLPQIKLLLSLDSAEINSKKFGILMKICEDQENLINKIVSALKKKGILDYDFE
eukprot:TRINITY_DN3612_c0_g1_i4.p1 TRINITY_DN3612_c0_g1~~TRINITY_DN3612_c0_g1_i4.p1  ORF type:complete len:310 (-),score=90.14 TRINITY_DN3612_c0_g1_i4:114-1043(-)